MALWSIKDAHIIANIQDYGFLKWNGFAFHERCKSKSANIVKASNEQSSVWMLKYFKVRYTQRL